jgi:uncharacterized protein YecE (DUF72 family)
LPRPTPKSSVSAQSSTLPEGHPEGGKFQTVKRVPGSPRIYAGTSGWAYPSWKPGFYPADIPTKRFLPYYASHFNAVEVNYSFRKLPSPEMLGAWLAAVPPDFRFSFKAPQRITHFRRLLDCHEAVAEFVASIEPVRAAGKLGPLLFQLPPNFKADHARLKAFLSAPAFKGRKKPRIAFEFRHESWFTNETYTLLRALDAALCIAESEDLQTPEIDCARNFAYFRLRRTGSYSKKRIAAIAEDLSAIAIDKDVFVYFKHEEEPTGALNALALRKTCELRAGER